MKNKQSEQLALFRQLLINHFNESDLRTLCFDLGHDYELLPGREKAEKARELIAYFRRIDELDTLLQACQKARPQIAWPQITGGSSLLSPTTPPTQRKKFRIGVALSIIVLGAALLIFLARTFWGPQDNQALPSLPTNSNCVDTYLADIQEDHQAAVAVGETAYDFYFSDWGDRANPSLLGLRLIESGKSLAAVRFLFLPGSTQGSTAFEIVGVVNGNCQEVGTFSDSSLLIENWEHLDLDLPDKAITISFNWQGDHLRLGVRKIGAP